MSLVLIIESVLKDVLVVVYQNIPISLVMTTLIMMVYVLKKDNSVSDVFMILIHELKNKKKLRSEGLFYFYLFILLNKTLLCRTMWVNPLQNVLGIWGITDQNGNLYTEHIENMFLFIPFVLLLFNAFPTFGGKKLGIIPAFVRGTGFTIIVSVGIESLQLFLKLGTFQLSDIVFNALGGAVGGMITGLLQLVRNIHKNRRSKNEDYA